MGEQDLTAKEQDAMFGFASKPVTSSAASTASHHASPSTRKAVAAVDASDDQEFLTEEAGSRLSEVRIAVARNPATSEAALTALVSDPDQYVRRELTRNPKVPMSIIRSLASDKDRATATIAAGILTKRTKAHRGGFVSPLPDASRLDLLRALMAHTDTPLIQVLSLAAADPSLTGMLHDVLSTRRPELTLFLASVVAEQTGLTVEVSRALLTLTSTPPSPAVTTDLPETD